MALITAPDRRPSPCYPHLVYLVTLPTARALDVLYEAGGDFASTDRLSRRDKKIYPRGRKQILQRLLTDPPS